MEEQLAAADSSSSASPTNWRKEVDERLRRLHSLLFGADAALERGDAAAAQALALRLLGFLDSQTLSTDAGPEAAFVAPIRAAASSCLAAASRARAPESDRAVFELAKKDVYCVFTKQGDVNIEKIKRPKYFQALHQKFSGNAADQLGTGKTMIGKAIAGEAKATFFYISASSLTSKWIGEGEKLVRALFGVACCRQPAVIFVDEIDSLLSQRKSDGEHESSRRLKTQFLIEMEGFDSGNEQILLIGYSGSDMKNLVKDASMGPLREAFQQGVEITKLNKEDMRPVMLKDFEAALQEVRPSVSASELGIYEEWNKQFGSLSI
ncbi:hypothetical protein ACQ4PT_008731 [Festuca glaucescens]